MSGRPSIQVDVRVNGDFLATINLGNESNHPFTYEQLSESVYPAGDTALMLHYCGLLCVGYNPEFMFTDFIRMMQEHGEAWFLEEDDLPE